MIAYYREIAPARIRSLFVVAWVLGTALLLSTPAHAQFKFKLSRGQEASLGKDTYAQVSQKPGLVTKGKEYELVQRVGKRLVERNKLGDLGYTFHLVNDDTVNAFATPGAYVYVNRGLLKYMAYDESQLAGVMGHEMGHVKDRHPSRAAEKQIQSQLGLGLLGMVLGGKNKDLMSLLGGASGMANLKYSRDMEEWADRYGVEMSFNAGYDPYGMQRGLETLTALFGKGSNVDEWLNNHPSNSGRVKRVAQIALEVSGHEQGYWAIPCPPKKHPLYEEYKGMCGKGKPIIDLDYPLRQDDGSKYHRETGRQSR